MRYDRYLGIKIDPATAERLFEIAEREDRSASSVVRMAIKAELERRYEIERRA